MDAKEFNKLIKLYHCNIDAANKLNVYCITIIRNRLFFRNGSNDVESLAHSVLEKFIRNFPDYYIAFPKAYLKKCTDNYLSTLKRKMERETALTYDIGYEQRFEELEKFEAFHELEKHLDKLDAVLIYGHCIEEISEKKLAKDMGMSYDAVRQRISRAKKKLKIILEQNVTQRHK